MISGKFSCVKKKKLIIATFRCATNSPTRFHTIIHLPLLVWGGKIPLQNEMLSLSPWSRSGQVRPARQWRARFRAQAQKHNMYTTAIYMRQKLTNEGKCEFPHDVIQFLSMIPNLRTCNTHEVWIPKYVVDGPRDE